MRTRFFDNRFLISIFLLTIVSSVMAQLVSPPSSILQQANIGLVDEFMKRFNGEEGHPELTSKGKENRRENLICLFNFDQFAGKGDSIISEIDNMISTVMSESIKIDYADSRWFAQALCQGRLDGKDIVCTLYLTVESRDDDMYKWVISNVEGKIFDIMPKEYNEAIMLYPDDHETKFISLSRMTKEQPTNIELFMNKEFRYDSTSVFAYLVYTNRLKIDFVKSLEFIFTEVPGYMFSIRYFHRETSNSGWLISDLWTADENTKNEYLRTLNIKPYNSHDSENKLSNERQISYNQDLNITDRTSRNKEYIRLMNDYISFIRSESKHSSTDLYKEKLKNLFVPDSRVIIRKDDDAIEVGLDEFCNEYLAELNISLSLDSIQIPTITLNEQDPTNEGDTWFVPSTIMNLKTGTCSDSDELTQLYYRKELTEDGEEWIPVFGDLYITINANQDE